MDNLSEIIKEMLLEQMSAEMLVEKTSIAQVIRHPRINGALHVTKAGIKSVVLGRDHKRREILGKETTYDIHHNGVKVGELTSRTHLNDSTSHVGHLFGRELHSLHDRERTNRSGAPDALRDMLVSKKGDSFLNAVSKEHPDKIKPQ